MKFISVEQFNKNLESNKRFQNFKKKHDLAHEVSIELVRARIAKGYSQKKLASLIGTQQANIARIENGKSLPSLRILNKIARTAYRSYLIPPKFAFLVENERVTSSIEKVNESMFIDDSVLEVTSPYATYATWQAKRNEVKDFFWFAKQQV